MPSSKGYKRNYAQERRTAKVRGETDVGHMSGDAVRHRARRKLTAKVGITQLRGKDVDHKRKVASGGSNSLSNLRIRSRHANRADNLQNPKRTR